MTGWSRKYAGILILLISLGGLAYYVARNWASFRQLSLVQPLFVIPACASLIAEYFVIGWITRLLTRSLGVDMGFRESFAVSIMTGYYNMILPFRAGIATRAAYLKQRHELSYASFAAMFSASYILMDLVASVLGAGSLIFVGAQAGLVAKILLLVFLGIFGSHVLLILWSPHIRESAHTWVNHLIRIINSWLVIKKDRGLVLAVTCLSLCQLLLEVASLLCQFRAFGIQVGLVKCMFLVAVGLLGLLIQITPSGLGVVEALLAFSAQAIAVTPAQTLAAALLGRAISFFVLLALGPITSYALFGRANAKSAG